MTIAADLLATCHDSFGQGIPVIEDIIRYNGKLIDSSRFDNSAFSKPFDVYQFPDKSELIISGSHLKTASVRTWSF